MQTQKAPPHLDTMTGPTVVFRLLAESAEPAQWTTSARLQLTQFQDDNISRNWIPSFLRWCVENVQQQPWSELQAIRLTFLDTQEIDEHPALIWHLPSRALDDDEAEDGAGGIAGAKRRMVAHSRAFVPGTCFELFAIPFFNAGAAEVEGAIEPCAA